MMTFKTLTAASVLAVSALLLTGCDQAEKSAQQLMGKAAESAKLAQDELVAGIIENIKRIAGHRLGRRPVFHGKQSKTCRIGRYRPARLRLPPVVDDRDLEDALRPFQSLGIGALSRKEQCTQS